MSSLIVDVGAGPPRSVIGAKLAEEFRKRNMPLLVKYAEETQHTPPRFGGAHTKPKPAPRRVLGLQEFEETGHSSLSQYEVELPQSEHKVVGGVYTRSRLVPRRVLGLQELEEPKEKHMSLSYYELQDDPDTPRIEGEANKSYSGGADGLGDHWPGGDKHWPSDESSDDSDGPDYLGDGYLGGGYLGGGEPDGYMVPTHTYQSDIDVDAIPFFD